MYNAVEKIDFKTGEKRAFFQKSTFSPGLEIDLFYIIIQGVSDEMYLFYFDIAFFWKMILNFRLLENNELICPFYACFFVFENLDFGHWNENLLFFPEGISKKFLRQLIQWPQKR